MTFGKSQAQRILDEHAQDMGIIHDKAWRATTAHVSERREALKAHNVTILRNMRKIAKNR